MALSDARSMTTVIAVRSSLSLPLVIGTDDASAAAAPREPVVKASELRAGDLTPVESDEHAARKEIAAVAAFYQQARGSAGAAVSK